MANSRRKCAYCKERQLAETMFISGPQAFCNKDHYIEYQVSRRESLVKKGEKIQRKELADRKKELRPRSWYLKEAQKWFNKFIRLRDKGEPCCSCDKPDDGSHQRHASHYRSVGACSSMRYSEQNVWASCSVCNNYLSGNLAEYRIRLIDKIGLEQVEWIERQSKAYKWTESELVEIIETYKLKCKEIENELASTV